MGGTFREMRLGTSFFCFKFCTNRHSLEAKVSSKARNNFMTEGIKLKTLGGNFGSNAALSWEYGFVA